MDYTVHGTLQARTLEWVTIPFSRGSSQPRDWTQVSHIAGGFFTSWATREAQEYWSGQPIPSPGESSQTRNQTRVSCIAGGFFTNELWGEKVELSLLNSWPWDGRLIWITWVGPLESQWSLSVEEEGGKVSEDVTRGRVTWALLVWRGKGAQAKERAAHLEKAGKQFLSQSFQKECSPASTSASALWDPFQMSDLHNCKLINLCCFGLFSLW